MQKYLLGNKEVKAFEIGRIEANTIYSKDNNTRESAKVSDGFLRTYPLDESGYYVDYLDGSVGFNAKEAFEKIATLALTIHQKTFINPIVSEAKKNVSDLVVYGDGDTFKLICKSSSETEGWIRSTEAMVIPGIGCVIRVFTQCKNGAISEALTFVPNVSIFDIDENKDKGRKIRKPL